MRAAENGNLTAVRYLIDADIDFNTRDDGSTALMHATRPGNNFEVVRYLINNGAAYIVNAPNFRGETPLIYAAQNGEIDVVRFLVQVGANVNSADDTKRTALLYSIICDHLPVAQFVLANGAYIDALDLNEQTSLMAAIRMNNLEAVQLLIQNNANVNIMDDYDNAAQLLIKNGAAINAVNRVEWTSLIFAAAANGELDANELCDAVVRFLVESGADVNVADKCGWTSLMYAAQNGNLGIVKILLDNDADVSTVNNDGRTAIFIATTHDHTDIQHLLMQFTPHVLQPTEKSDTGIQLESQIPTNCLLSAFDVKLLEFFESKNVGGNYRALWLDAEVVVKLFVPTASVTTFGNEVAVWYQLRHPNVIKLYGVCDIGHYFFVCELASNASCCMQEAWKSANTMEVFCMKQHWVSHTCTNEKIVHGNLCSNSVLVASDGLVKLADFQVSGSTTIWSARERSSVGFGSFCWQAPECVRGEPTSLASDIYSFCLCAVAAVTGKSLWYGCLNDYTKSLKEKWDVIVDPAYCAPVVDMTTTLRLLASKMCANDPRSRVSASTVVRMLEKLAVIENTKQQRSRIKPESNLHISAYTDDDLSRMWQKLLDVAATKTVDKPQLVCELESLYECMDVEKQPIELVHQFYNLITDCIRVIAVGSQQYRIIQLSSTTAQGRNMTAIYRRIDAIWALIDDSHATEERKQRREQLRLQQQDAFVSEVSQTIVVLRELDTDEDREAFVSFLKTEINSHGPSYTPAQLSVLKKAYSDLNACLTSDVVRTTPEWFLPWYELEMDGANYLAEGGFGEVYRAKWLESEVIVKQVKSSNLDN
ncbi:Serine/threonine protein kinase [Phytophthora megakarya]|uniref:Serine/threonine protein kinase n=1 Tax=Phytophthora megakarya TaxID=4795 RepID=A0A225VDG1_9STRA|nr:Serine/threonine protein kinase [Phytophthora megakarya]